jgi:hypothetical protein
MNIDLDECLPASEQIRLKAVFMGSGLAAMRRPGMTKRSFAPCAPAYSF